MNILFHVNKSMSSDTAWDAQPRAYSLDGFRTGFHVFGCRKQWMNEFTCSSAVSLSTYDASGHMLSAHTDCFLYHKNCCNSREFYLFVSHCGLYSPCSLLPLHRHKLNAVTRGKNCFEDKSIMNIKLSELLQLDKDLRIQVSIRIYVIFSFRTNPHYYLFQSKILMRSG